MNKNPNIVLVDDDWHQADHVAAAFRLRGCKVDVIGSNEEVDAALANGRWKKPDLFLVDVMMPPGGKYNESETCGGMITGFLLARDIRAHYPKTPIILWSTAPFRGVSESAKAYAPRISHCIFMSKHEGVEAALRRYEEFRKNKKFETSILSDIWDSVSLKFGYGGVTFDPKAFHEKRKKKT